MQLTHTHNHTPFFNADPQSCPASTIVFLRLLCSVAQEVLTMGEALHTDSDTDTDFVPQATLSVYRKVGPHSDNTSTGVGDGGVDFSAGLEV